MTLTLTLTQLSPHLSPSRVLLDRVSLAPAPPPPGAAEASTSRCASSCTAPPGAADGDKYPDDMLADGDKYPDDMLAEDSGAEILSDGGYA